jgi:hypothetical protein
MFSKLAFGFAFLVVAVIIFVVASSSSSSSSLLVAAVSYDPEIAWPALWYSKVLGLHGRGQHEVLDLRPQLRPSTRAFKCQGVHVNSTMGEIIY